VEAMGRRPASSSDERLRVRVLADEGFSQREIAERVFGERGLHGRIERILKRDRTVSADPDQELRDLLARLETLAGELKAAEIPELDELVDLFKRRSLQERLEREPDKVRVSELAALLKLEIRLEQRRQYERIRKLTARPES
jgi:hypothetical protein